MGLEEGKEGSKKLVTMMKKGEIGIDKLFAFLDLVAKRAKETGAYDLAINGKTAAETRMANSYDLFAQAFGKMFNQEIQAPFKGFEKFFDKMTAWIDEQEKLKKETGEIGKFETSVGLVTSLFGDLSVVLQGIIEGWGNLFSWLPGGQGGGVGSYLANRELTSSYKDYTSKGGTLSKTQFAKEQYYAADAFGTEAGFGAYANSLDPTGSLAAGYKIDPLKDKMLSMIDSLIQSSKETAQALLDGKYSNTAPPAVFNITGVNDPIAVGNIVDQKLKENFQIGR